MHPATVDTDSSKVLVRADVDVRAISAFAQDVENVTGIIRRKAVHRKCHRDDEYWILNADTVLTMSLSGKQIPRCDWRLILATPLLRTLSKAQPDPPQ